MSNYLTRVYGDSCNFEQENASEQNNETPKEKNDTDKEEKLELKYSKQQLENERKERERERELLKTQIESLQESLKTSPEGHNRATLLLENQQGGVGEWEKSIKALEVRLANQEKAEKERGQREEKILRQNRALKKALDEEKSKGFFKKIFG